LTPVEIGILGIIALFILLLLRVPVGISMIIVAAVGNSMLSVTLPALTKLGSDIVRTSQNYALSVVPLFVLMGIFLAKSNLGAALFDLLNYFLGKRKGGMAYATLGASAMFGAVCGSVIAATTTLTAAAVPEMRKYKYDPGFATAVTAAGAAMGAVIPPSSALVVYGFLTEESIGQVLMAGILPGILIMIMLMLTVPIILAFKPHYAPATVDEKIPFPWQSLKIVWAVPFIFLAVFGGIYLGWTTTTEAGAIGAFTSLVFALSTRKLPMKAFFESLATAGKITGMVFFMIIGGSVFCMFLTRSLIPLTITQYVTTLTIAPFWIMLFFLLVYTLLGVFMDEMAILVIMTPIVYPIVITLGYNGIWFGVITIVMMLEGLLSPPVGIVTLVASSVAKIPSTRVFIAQWPFWITLNLAAIILIAFPRISTLIPSMMYGS